MDNVLWNTFFPFVISIVAGIATTYIIDISRRKIVYYSIVTKQPKNHQKEHTISTFFIWCDKYHVITEDDIDTAFPPCIEIDGNHEIYGVEIIREPNSPDFNRATVEKHTKKCNLSFKQFDFNNVIMLNVFHSGKSVKFIGNINAYDTESVKITKLNSVVIWGVVFFFIGLTLFALTNCAMNHLQEFDWAHYLVFVYFIAIVILYVIWTALNLKFASIPKTIINHLKNQKHKTK